MKISLSVIILLLISNFGIAQKKDLPKVNLAKCGAVSNIRVFKETKNEVVLTWDVDSKSTVTLLYRSRPDTVWKSIFNPGAYFIISNYKPCSEIEIKFMTNCRHKNSPNQTRPVNFRVPPCKAPKIGSN